jgi:hypothetical protein
MFVFIEHGNRTAVLRAYNTTVDANDDASFANVCEHERENSMSTLLVILWQHDLFLNSFLHNFSIKMSSALL